MSGKHKKAFTLVELLVVIGIIALLIGILLPALNAARQMSNSTKCLANLKQLGNGLLLYVNDNHGYLPPVQGVSSTGATSDGATFASVSFQVNTVATLCYMKWYGGFTKTGSIYVPQAGLLYPYLKTGNVFQCPTAADLESLNTQLGVCDYAYSSLAGNMTSDQTQSPIGCGVKLARFKGSADKAAMWDSGRINGGKFDRLAWGYPSTGNPYSTPQPTAYPDVHALHRTYANVLWLDGHAAPTRPVYFDTFTYPTAGYTPALSKQFQLGVLDTDDNQLTDESYQLN